MADTLIVQFGANDKAVAEAIKAAFGTGAEFVDVKNFDAGVGDYIQAIVPAIPAAAQILVAYFTRPRTPKLPGRVVVTKDGDISIEGFSREDVERLIDKVREE
jgi:hypothetical protein